MGASPATVPHVPPAALKASLAAALSEPREQALPARAIALSFEQIYDEHFDFVWRNVRRLGVLDADLDDAVQEVFLTVHRRLDDFEARSSVRTWLFAIALRVASDARRLHKRKSPHAQATSGVVEADTVADEGARGPHEEASRAEAARVVHRLLAELEPKKRAVLILSELEHMSVPEIAEAVGANVNTTSARLRAARSDFEKAVARERARDGWRLR